MTQPKRNLIGKRLKAARTEARVTQAELGKKLGFSHSTIGAYERGRLRVPAPILTKIAKILGKPPSYFFDDYSKASIAALEEKVDRLIMMRNKEISLDEFLRVRGFSREGRKKILRKVEDVCKSEKISFKNV